MNSKIASRRKMSIIDLFISSSFPGMILIFCSVVAILLSNSSLNDWYQSFLNTHIAIHIGKIHIDKHLSHFVNDALMVLFFLLVGLEIKREILVGELSSVKKMTLPLVGAVGGVVFPAIIFLLILNLNGVSHDGTSLIKGWAIPTATDIAFALAILSIFGSRVPVTLKIFLTALAIIDDLMAIIIIALFYTSNLSMEYILYSGLIVVFLILCNCVTRLHKKYLFYLLGLVLWYFVLNSGVHATVAGVVLAMFIPLKDKSASQLGVTKQKRSKKEESYMLQQMEKSLHAPVSLFILPLFAFCNAGVSFAGMTVNQLFSPLSLAIAFGLFFGKQIGVFLLSWLICKLKLASLSSTTNWIQFYGVAILTGIGFTMSLFIGTLSFGDNPLLMSQVKIGVILGSLLSVIAGMLVLYFSTDKK